MPSSTTVIIALKFQGGVVIAADSQASDTNARVRWPVEKLDSLKPHACVIGFSGSVGRADAARERLAGNSLHPGTFAIAPKVQEHFSSVLAPIYKQMAEAPVMPGQNPMTLWGLVALWTGDDACILELEPNADSCWQQYFHAIGSGSATAYAVYRTLGGKRLIGVDEAKAIMAVLRILRTCVDVEMWGVSEPLDVWVVTKGSAKRISRDELQAHLQAVDAWEEDGRKLLFG